MYRELFSNLESVELPLAAMLFFLVVFVLVLVRVFALKRRRDYDSIAALPLDDSKTSENKEVKP